MSRISKLLVFTLSDVRCALPLTDIERTLHAIEITPVPKAPEIVMGLVNIQGRIIPVLNICKLLRLPEIEIRLNDQIILARTTSCPVAILVDTVQGVVECTEQDIIAPDELYPGIEYLEGVTKLKDGIVYIYNLDRFLSSEERSEIEHLLSEGNFMPTDREA